MQKTDHRRKNVVCISSISVKNVIDALEKVISN